MLRKAGIMKKIAGFLITLFIVLAAGAATAFAASPARVQVLMIGDRDEWVTELQQALYDGNYLKQRPTGYFGTNTQAAVIEFQKKENLTVDGKAGPVTRKKLLGKAYQQIPDTRMAEDSGDGEEVLALRAGDRGDEVEKAQKKLKELGYYTYGSITGYFGPVTKDAVIRFQKASDLTADGIIGAATSAKLYAADAKAGVYSRGDSGSEVKKIQTRLKELNYFSSSVTGFFGSITEKAVKDFQRKHALGVDGKVGAKTSAMLFSDKAQQANKSDLTTDGEPEPVLTDAKRLINAASEKIGCKYVYGAEGPNTFDCSGLVYHSLKSIGVKISRKSSASYALVAAWKDVAAIADLQPGDLMFFRSSSSERISHMSIYLGGNQMLHAVPSAGAVTKASVSNYWKTNFVKGKRIF